MKTEKQLEAFLSSRKFACAVIGVVERDAGDNFKSLRRKRHLKNKKLTIQEYVALAEPDVAQQKGKLTVLLASDFEGAVIEVLLENGFEIDKKNTNNGEEKSDVGIKVLSKVNSKPTVKQYEIKVSQLSNQFQGATHSKKVPNYILFNIKVNMNYILPSLNKHDINGSIISAYVATHYGHLNWKGTASDNNSRTVATIPGIVTNKQHQISLGDIRKMSNHVCRKESTAHPERKVGAPWALKTSKLLREDLTKYRNNNNILEVK